MEVKSQENDAKYLCLDPEAGVGKRKLMRNRNWKMFAMDIGTRLKKCQHDTSELEEGMAGW